MKRRASPATNHGKAKRTGIIPRPVKPAKDTEAEHLRYASPPCYLAEFADAEFRDLTAK